MKHWSYSPRKWCEWFILLLAPTWKGLWITFHVKIFYIHYGCPLNKKYYSPNRTQSCFNLTYHRLFLLCARNLHEMYMKWTTLYINAEMMFLKSMKNIISAVVPISLNLIQTYYYSEKREFHLNNMLLEGNNFIYTWL